MKTFFNRIIVKPHEEKTDFYGLEISDNDITGVLTGTVIAVADNIEDIKAGDILHYSNKVEEILINEQRHHILSYINAYWAD